MLGYEYFGIHANLNYLVTEEWQLPICIILHPQQSITMLKAEDQNMVQVYSNTNVSMCRCDALFPIERK